ncbi:hypothetical protein TRIUR3_09668 [Triticum urartu]|uniref:Uncharacterized protein n=1 Tax=Triticum urartu TaxID=4572 RepID=M7ZH56_TRIUA|nr:hypothetical protein TRIUR3_09668 [Triticum urartu]
MPVTQAPGRSMGPVSVARRELSSRAWSLSSPASPQPRYGSIVTGGVRGIIPGTILAFLEEKLQVGGSRGPCWSPLAPPLSITTDRHMKALLVPSSPLAALFMYGAISKRGKTG